MNADENEPRMNANAREWKRALPARYALHFFALREKISNLKTHFLHKKDDFHAEIQGSFSPKNAGNEMQARRNAERF